MVGIDNCGNVRVVGEGVAKVGEGVAMQVIRLPGEGVAMLKV